MLAVYMPAYEAIASLPIERALLIVGQNFVETKWSSINWAPLAMYCCLIRLMVNILFPVLSVKNPPRAVYYVTFAIVYALFIWQICHSHKQNLNDWVSSAVCVIVYYLALFVVQARLQSLIFRVGD